MAPDRQGIKSPSPQNKKAMALNRGQLQGVGRLQSPRIVQIAGARVCREEPLLAAEEDPELVLGPEFRDLNRGTSRFRSRIWALFQITDYWPLGA